jgi:peptidylprolyl isomerase
MWLYSPPTRKTLQEGLWKKARLCATKTVLRMEEAGDGKKFHFSRRELLQQSIAAVAATALSQLGISAWNYNTVVEPAYAANRTLSSASGAVNKDPESLLRWALPMNNESLRQLQTELEAAVRELKQKKWSQIADHTRKSSLLVQRQADKLLADIPEAKRAESQQMLNAMESMFESLQSFAVAKDSEKFESLAKDMLRQVGYLEELSVKSFPFQVPNEYSHLPQLLGRATVEIVLRKGGENGSPKQFDIDGNLYDKARLVLVIDGYSAPVTGGNFVDLVSRGFYDGLPIIRSDGFVIQSGDPEPGGKVHGFIDPKTNELRTIPLEIFAKGDPMPLYGMTLEDDGRGGQATVLPLTAYGSLCFARNEFEADSGSSQFFWFLFEPDLTPAGRNLLDGRFAVFGYTTDGAFFLRDTKVGDVIESAKVIRGLENLHQPRA